MPSGPATEEEEEEEEPVRDVHDLLARAKALPDNGALLHLYGDDGDDGDDSDSDDPVDVKTKAARAATEDYYAARMRRNQPEGTLIGYLRGVYIVVV